MNRQHALTALRTLYRPVDLFRSYHIRDFKPDLLAGLTVAVVLLPQGIAFALIAELPPEMGLYAAVIGAIIGALWGYSNHCHTGPANAISLLVLSTLLSVAKPGTTEFLVAAGMLAVISGLIQLFLGLARLGMLVNFVSHSVVVGFTAGAGVLIMIKQIPHFFRISSGSGGIIEAIQAFPTRLMDAHWTTVCIGLGTIVVMLALARYRPRWPASLIGMTASAAVVGIFGLDLMGVSVIGSLPGQLPPLAGLPLTDLNLWTELGTGAIAVAAISLVETSAITRAIASQSGQRQDSNQEFVGQGLANIFCGLFSGYPCAGSFSRSALNFQAGARSPVAALISGIFVFMAMLLLAPLAMYLPRAALAAVLILTGFAVIDRAEIKRIWRGTRGDAAIMIITFMGTLFFHIEFAVLFGIVVSFVVYIWRTSKPRVYPVIPDSNHRHFAHRPDESGCPQLGVLNILGDLYFGAVHHVEEAIHRYHAEHSSQQYLILRMRTINQCDYSGIHMLESVTRTYRDQGGDVFLVHVRPHVLEFMKSTRFFEFLGDDHFLEGDTMAIEHLFYRVIDPAVCIYECDVRIWRECLNLPRPSLNAVLEKHQEPALLKIPEIEATDLWRRIHDGPLIPLVIDVREPREHHQERIIGSDLKPLPTLPQSMTGVLRHRPLVLVCRSGRRSMRAAAVLHESGFKEISILKGGLIAWKAAGLLTAVEVSDTH